MPRRNKDSHPQPKYPFRKMPYQEKGDSDRELHDYETDKLEELDLGESDLRTKGRTLADERDAGHEP